MTDPLPPAAPCGSPSRRRVLGLLASLPLSRGLGGKSFAPAAVELKPVPGAARPRPSAPREATLLVGGPPDGATGRWAGLVAPALTQGLPPGSHIALRPLGGLDGVTAANRFAAAPAPDGSRLLFAPGATVQAWLAGETRARFDVGTWLPVLAGAAPAVLMGRFPLARLRGRKVRVAVERLPGSDMAALLGLHLLGAHPVPVPGLSRPGRAAALLAGHIDAALLTGPGVAALVGRLTGWGLVPLAGFGAAGALRRDPAFPTLPHLAELCPPALTGGALFAAWRASALSAQLVFSTTLPALTPAAMVALWRDAASTAATNPVLAEALRGDGVSALAGPEAMGAQRVLAAPVPALLALRQWLSAHRDWRVG
jgi:hypothetical protein